MNLEEIKNYCISMPHTDHFNRQADNYLRQLMEEVERLEEIETDLNNTIGFMQRGIDDWKAKAGPKDNGMKSCCYCGLKLKESE